MLYKNRCDKTPIDKDSLDLLCVRHGFSLENVPVGVSYTNDVFLTDSGDYIKVFTDQWGDPVAGRREIELLKAARSVGVPAPDVLLFEYADKEFPRNYALLGALPGVPLVKAMTELPISALKTLREYVLALQSIRDVSGFFNHNPSVHRTYPNHGDFLHDLVEEGLRRIRSRGGNTSALDLHYTKSHEFLEQHDYGLCHNDLTPKHVMVFEGKLTGLLDFEWAYHGQSLSDIMQWVVAAGTTGLNKTVVASLDIFGNDLDQEMAAFYAARQFIICAAWTHRKVKENYAQSCLDRAQRILQRNAIMADDFIWEDGSPIL